MATFLKIYLIVTGLAGALAIFVPTTVIIGFFLLIIPGVFLSLSPTAFLYGLLFACLWFPLSPYIGPWATTLIALPATIGLFYLIAAPRHAEAAALLARVVRPDVLPETPIVLAGDVRLDLQNLKRQRNSASGAAVACDGICAQLLFTPGVTSVTLNPFERGIKPDDYAIVGEPLDPAARTFRIAPRDACTDPQETVGAELLLELTTARCIVSEPALRRFDQHIAAGDYWLFAERAAKARHWSLDRQSVRVDHLEMRGRGGTLLLREMAVETAAIGVPLMIEGSGDMQSFRFGWRRKTLSNKFKFYQVNRLKLLRAHTTLRPEGDPGLVAHRARDRLATLVADPSASADDAGWNSGEVYFDGFDKGAVTAADRALLPKLIDDPRMVNFRNIYKAAKALGDEATILRAPIVRRLSGTVSDRRDRDPTGYLTKVLYQLPPGIFATPTTAEIAWLADPVARWRAQGLIARQSDRGAAAVPQLVELIAFHSQALIEKRADRSYRSTGDEGDAVVVDAARVALCRLGPAARDALPPLMALFRAGTIATQKIHDRDWTLLLAMLGEPVESFSKPDNMGGTDATYRQHLRDRVEKFRPDRNCEFNYI